MGYNNEHEIKDPSQETFTARYETIVALINCPSTTDAGRVWRACYRHELKSVHFRFDATVETYRELIAPPIGPDEERFILNAMDATLSKREKYILAHRLGLTVNGERLEPKSCNAIAAMEEPRPNKEWVRLIEKEALERLRIVLDGYPALQRFGRARRQPLLQVAEQLRQAENRIACLEAQLRAAGLEPEHHPFNEHLFKRCAEVGFSTRSQGCFENAKITYIYQLVERNEADLLDLYNFGVRSLKEVTRTLQTLRLSLGTTLPPTFPRDFAALAHTGT